MRPLARRHGGGGGQTSLSLGGNGIDADGAPRAAGAGGRACQRLGKGL